MFYIENVYTDEIIDVADNLFVAVQIARHTPDSIVTDEDNNVYYSSI